MPMYLCKPFFCKKRPQNKIAIDNYDDKVYAVKLGESIQNSFKRFLRKKTDFS